MHKDAQAELYQFVRDRHAKLLSARSMAQTRLGHLLVLTGFLIATLTSVGIPQLLPAFDVKHKCLSGSVLTLATIAFGTTFIFLGLLLKQLFGAVTRFAFATPYADRDLITSSMQHPKMDVSRVYQGLTALYLDAIEENRRESGIVGRHLRKSFFFLQTTLISGAVFVLLLVAARVLAP